MSALRSAGPAYGRVSSRLSNARVLTLLVLFAAGSSGAQVPAWKPDKQVEIVVGASPGGGNDITARVMQKVLQSSKLVENVQVTNKPGGSHTIAWSYMNQHQGDGHYVQIINEPLVTNKLAGVSGLDHNDFTPLARLFNEYVLFVAKPDSPFADGKYLAERMQKDPVSVVIGFGAARGNSAHLAIGIVAKAAGVDIPKLKLVVFDSGSKSVTAAIGGHVTVTSTVPASARQHVLAGRLRGIAVTSDKRLGGDFANVPTWKELGVDAYYSSWRCLVGPKGMSAEQIAFWENAVARMSQTEEWKTALAGFVQEPAFQGSADLRRFLNAQAVELKGALASLGMLK